jgi:calcineurin-like phosphoesterase family protein
MDFFIADPHFGHANIVIYCGRPFKDVDEMDRVIIENWNSTVKSEDTIFILGDFSWGNSDRILQYINALSGRKILVAGNHDQRTVTYWKKRGIEAYKTPIGYNDWELILSHEPVPFPTVPNIHGHTHGNIHRGAISLHGVHVCVSAEVVGYTPQSVDRIRERIAELRMEENYD